MSVPTPRRPTSSSPRAYPRGSAGISREPIWIHRQMRQRAQHRRHSREQCQAAPRQRKPARRLTCQRAMLFRPVAADDEIDQQPRTGRKTIKGTRVNRVCMRYPFKLLICPHRCCALSEKWPRSAPGQPPLLRRDRITKKTNNCR